MRAFAKSKIFFKGELVDTVFLSETSPTWRGIEHGLSILKKGIIWRVGDGSKIQIWRDPWVPRPPSLGIKMKKDAQ
jgi:hypothetical protein